MTASADAPIDEAALWAQVDWDRARREVRITVTPYHLH